MLELFASHADGAILTRLFPRLESRNRSPNTYEIGSSWREYAQTRIKFHGVSQNQVENDLEVRIYDSRERRAQVLAMDAISLLSLFFASHIAAVRHGHKGVQRDVKCRGVGIGLKRLGKARFARARGAMQNDME